MNTEQVPKPSNVNADPVQTWGRLPSDGTRAKETPPEFTGAWVTACSPEETCGNTGSSTPRKQRGFREEWTERGGMTEGPVVPEKPGNAGGGKGPWFKSDAPRSEGEEIGASLTTPKSVWELQQALHVKAKREPACRFHSLYDKLYRKDVLIYAWRCCRANGGAPGVDGVTFARIESGGVDGWLEELGKELREKSYRPQAVRRVWIPKPGSDKRRPLGAQPRASRSGGLRSERLLRFDSTPRAD